MESSPAPRPGSGFDHRFPWWCLLLAGGFAYVAVVLCGRGDPFRSANGTHADLARILLLAPLFFYLGPRHNLPALRGQPWRAIATRTGLNYLLPLFLGLHFKYLGQFLGVGFSLRWADLSRLNASGAAALGGGVVLVGGLIAYHVALARRETVLRGYVAWLVAVPAALAARTWMLRETHTLHVHHYAWGGLLFPFCRFRTPLSLAAQALFLGIALEGACRHGMEPVWYPR